MTAIPLNNRETAVYRLFDTAAGTLLYVGASCNVDPRIDQHCAKPWWSDMDDVTVTWYPDRATALKQEAVAIATELPVYNIQKPDPNGIKTPAPRTRPADSGLTFEQVAAEVDIPELWLRAGVMRSELPHSCDNPDDDHVWFAPEDIRELHVIFDYAQGDRTVQWQRHSIRRKFRLGRCTHCVI